MIANCKTLDQTRHSGTHLQDLSNPQIVRNLVRLFGVLHELLDLGLQRVQQRHLVFAGLKTSEQESDEGWMRQQNRAFLQKALFVLTVLRDPEVVAALQGFRGEGDDLGLQIVRQSVDERRYEPRAVLVRETDLKKERGKNRKNQVMINLIVQYMKNCEIQVLYQLAQLF